MVSIEEIASARRVPRSDVDPTVADTAARLDRMIRSFLKPTLDMFAVMLEGVGGLSYSERSLIQQGASAALHVTVLRKVLTLDAARVTGTLAEHHPQLAARVQAVVDSRVQAAITFAERFAADRARLSELDRTPPGELLRVTFDAGDGQRAGQTIVQVRFAHGRLVYKPRPVDVDRALASFLRRVLPKEHDPIRVPRVLARDGYGWAEHVEHRYCADEDEVVRYHRNLGRWLAIMRLLGGSALQSGNLVAAGPVPVVVDCETLFTSPAPGPPSGFGEAVDLAHELIRGSLLGTGMRPGPRLPEHGTTAQPTPEPVLGAYWNHVVIGFAELTDRLREHDEAGRLREWLEPFADVTVRAPLRDREVYVECAHLLWQPPSPPAVAEAVALLTRHAESTPGAPSDPYVVTAEVADVLDGDVPVFTTTPAMGLLMGPRGTTFGSRRDLLADTLGRWRATDPDLDRRVVQAALVSAHLNEEHAATVDRCLPSSVDSYRLDQRRRAVAARIVGQVVDTAVAGRDGTVTWVGPVLDPSGWAVRTLSHDLYGGTAGIAVLLAAYAREQKAGRADEVAGVSGVLRAAVHTMRLAEKQRAADAAAGTPPRNESAGGYVGLGSRICGWLLLRRLGAVGDEALKWATELAHQLPRVITEDPAHDVLVGRAGAIVPLLRLAEHTGDRQWIELAGRLGDQLVAAATPAATTHGGTGVCWTSAQFPSGVGGFGHGVTGIGWALARLAEITRDRAHADTAAAAFAYEGALYDPQQGGWLDLRAPNHIGAAWCHGSTGIGIAAVDLLRHGGVYADDWRDMVRVAALSSWHRGIGWNHTLCHGDLGVWELITSSMVKGLGPRGLDRKVVDAHMVAAVEEFGAVTGVARDTFTPGLLDGAGGIAYQLLRLDPDSELPSVLLPDPGPKRR
jgi:class II lanthipeptide synthase